MGLLRKVLIISGAFASAEWVCSGKMMAERLSEHGSAPSERVCSGKVDADGLAAGRDLFINIILYAFCAILLAFSSFLRANGCPEIEAYFQFESL
jgi:hypothetical protein